MGSKRHNVAMASCEARVLVVDDEPIVRDVLRRYLAREGFEVSTAADGQAALDAWQGTSPDVVVLDLMLPRIDGLEVFRRMRGHGDTAVLMLTARGEATDRIVGLELGADDYIAKPFSPREIVARVRAVLRRTQNGASSVEDHRPISLAGLEIDPRAREVRRGESALRLTPKEFDLLRFLASNPGTVYSRSQLLEQVWDIAYDGDPSTVTVHVRRLREKIERQPSDPVHLVTVSGAGYRFDP